MSGPVQNKRRKINTEITPDITSPIPISPMRNLWYSQGMKYLYLLRHAHTVPHGLDFADFDRPLDERGQEESQLVAQYLSRKKITFDLVMCSSALRAQETLKPLRPILGTSAIDVSENYYNIPEDKILGYIQQISDNIQKVLYIGHNPGVAFSILQFSDILPSQLPEMITPGTLVGMKFSLDHWRDVNWRKAEIIDVFQPNEFETKFPSPQEL